MFVKMLLLPFCACVLIFAVGVEGECTDNEVSVESVVICFPVPDVNCFPSNVAGRLDTVGTEIALPPIPGASCSITADGNAYTATRTGFVFLCVALVETCLTIPTVTVTVPIFVPAPAPAPVPATVPAGESQSGSESQ